MSGAIRAMAAPIVLLALPAAAGCYSLGHRMAPGVRTIAVPIFANATFPLRREIEFELTSAFRQQLQSRTSLVLIDETGNPDMIIRGRIHEFRERVVAEGRQDQKTESSVEAMVVIDVENYLEGTRRRIVVTDSQPFSILAGESFATGRRRAIRNLAELLVVRIEDWGEPVPAVAGN